MNNAAGFSAPEIEQAFLSCMMQWPTESFAVISSHHLTNEHFQTPRNRVLYAALEHFKSENKPFDLIAITDNLRESGFLETIGGPYYVTSTWNTCYSPLVLDYYAEILCDHHAKRLIAVSCGEILREVDEPMQEADYLLESAVARFANIPLRPVKEHTLAETLQKMILRNEQGLAPEDIIKTGIAGLDKDSPLRRADMPLIVGQRKAGKSILALSIALNLARQAIPILIFSVEDKEPKLIERLMAGICRLPLGQPLHKTIFNETAGELSRLPIHIKDDIYDLAGIKNFCQQLAKRAPIGCIIVDYAQKVVVPREKGVSREQEVAEVSRELRLLAMQLDTPVIVLSQLNKDNQARESLALEQDCTACWWIQSLDQDDDPNTRIICIPYQRNGPSGEQFKVTFLGQIARIENYQSP